MSKLHLLLLVVLLGSCLYLVKVSYEARRVFAQLDSARNEQRQLDIEWKRLDTERQAQATNVRVDRVARERLKMSTAVPGATHFVDEAASASTAGARK
jgi:cell division protein FtsL